MKVYSNNFLVHTVLLMLLKIDVVHINIDVVDDNIDVVDDNHIVVYDGNENSYNIIKT